MVRKLIERRRREPLAGFRDMPLKNFLIFKAGTEMSFHFHSSCVLRETFHKSKHRKKNFDRVFSISDHGLLDRYPGNYVNPCDNQDSRFKRKDQSASTLSSAGNLGTKTCTVAHSRWRTDMWLEIRDCKLEYSFVIGI